MTMISMVLLQNVLCVRVHVCVCLCVLLCRIGSGCEITLEFATVVLFGGDSCQPGDADGPLFFFCFHKTVHESIKN